MRARAVVVLAGTGVTHGPIPTLVIGGVQVSMQVDPTERGSIIAIEVPAGVGQASACQLESRITAQPVEVIAIGIAATNRQHAGSQDIGDRMRDVRRITPVSKISGKRIGDFAAAICQRKQHHAAVRGQPPAVERRCDFLRETDGRPKGSWLSSVMRVWPQVNTKPRMTFSPRLEQINRSEKFPSGICIADQRSVMRASRRGEQTKAIAFRNGQQCRRHKALVRHTAAAAGSRRKLSRSATANNVDATRPWCATQLSFSMDVENGIGECVMICWRGPLVPRQSDAALVVLFVSASSVRRQMDQTCGTST